MYRWLLILSLLSLPVAADEDSRLQQAAFAPQLQHQNRVLERKNQSLLRYLWADVYAAAFYSEAQVSPQRALREQRDRHLELYYFREISRDDMIKAAWVTLERQHAPQVLQPLRGELDRLHASFIDMRPGDRYGLDYGQATGLRLLRNGEVIFHSEDARLAQLYFGIWLAPEGLSDELHDALLAEH